MVLQVVPVKLARALAHAHYMLVLQHACISHYYLVLRLDNGVGIDGFGAPHKPRGEGGTNPSSQMEGLCDFRLLRVGTHSAGQ